MHSGPLIRKKNAPVSLATALARHLRHALRPVDQEEERAGLVGHRSREQRLPRPGRSVQQHPARRLHAERLEEGRVPERQLDHFADLGHLLLAPADVVVPDIVKLLLVLTLDRFALAVNDGVGRDNAELTRVNADHLELDRAEPKPREEAVTLAHRAVRFLEIRLEVRIEDVARDAFDGVVERKHVDALAVRNVAAWADSEDVTKANAQVLPDGLVHTDLR